LITGHRVLLDTNHAQKRSPHPVPGGFYAVILIATFIIIDAGMAS
jgi:hypothetical protein